MKELSIEQKAKAYDEAIAKAREIHRNEVEKRFDMEWLFPELKDSENERIKKTLIDYFKTYKKQEECGIKTFFGIPTDNILAWLEKQGKESITITIDDDPVASYNNVMISDKVEPRFKVGDWVVYNRNDSSREILYVYDIRDGRYYFNDNVHFSWSIKECDEKSHLWTIADAKPGDILFHSDSASNGIFIFKELLKYEFSEKVICYCDYDSEDHFCLGEHHTCCWADAKILHPATKEQCDLLFQKIEEAGYEWDAEKKELKLLITNGGDL